jgi:hypothetical protein
LLVAWAFRNGEIIKTGQYSFAINFKLQPQHSLKIPEENCRKPESGQVIILAEVVVRCLPERDKKYHCYTNLLNSEFSNFGGNLHKMDKAGSPLITNG